MADVKKINPQDLVAMDMATKDLPVRIELAYANNNNLLFGEQIYRSDARLWLHKDLAEIVIEAARLCAAQNLRLVLYDGLRTTDAQARMLKTRAVQENPHWLEDPPLLSSPGGGGHPRGMAVDVSLETPEGQLLDMGTAFDFLAEDSSPAQNPAHRQHPRLSPAVKANREKLDAIMLQAAQNCRRDLWPLPQEWWDFRLPLAVTERYAPLSDADLPPEMRMMG